MSNKHIQWLYEELPALVQQGVVPTESAEKLRQHYGPVAKSDGRRTMVVLFGILGAALIGGGIILLLAHNWDHLARPARAALSFMPLVLAQLLAALAIVRRPGSTAWREGTGAALSMSIIEASARILSEMATFESAGVAGDPTEADADLTR